MQKLRHRRGIVIDDRIVPGAGHAFREHIEELTAHVDDDLIKALREDEAEAASQ